MDDNNCAMRAHKFRWFTCSVQVAAVSQLQEAMTDMAARWLLGNHTSTPTSDSVFFNDNWLSLTVVFT